MASEKIINLENRKTYIVNADRVGENSMSCPVCSQDRKKKDVKCMSFNTIEGVGKCNHCGARFVRKNEDRETPRYVRPVPQSNVTCLPDRLVEWFKDRGISSSTLIDFKITHGRQFFPQVSKERNCINFNYFRNEDLINVKYRDAEKNFRLVKDAELILYNLDSIDHKYVVITEGEIDAMSYHEVGVKSVVSVPNGASKNNRLQYIDNCIDELDKVEKIYIATDDDEPGRVLQEEIARRLGKERCRRVSFFGKKDANELLIADPLMLPKTLEAAEEYPLEGVVTVDNLSEDIWRLRRDGLKRGCDISISEFNDLLTFVPGYVTGVTGIPNHGKSEFLDQIIVDLSVKHDWRFGIFSPENYPLQLHFAKLASKLLGVSFNETNDAQIISAMNYCRDNFFYIVPEEDNSLDSIIEHAKNLVKRYGINAIVIDAWNKLDHNYVGTETQHISKELDKLISFCRKYSVHAFVVAHPTKMSRDPKTQAYNVATLYDMAGSAHFYNKMDNGISVYREFFPDGSSQPQIYVQKVKFKHWGQQGSVTLQYDVPTGRYYFFGKRDRSSYISNEFIHKQELDL
jgi:twinkle protein